MVGVGVGLATRTGSDENPGSMDPSSLDTGVLWSDDVAALWSSVGKRRPVARATVWSSLEKSKDADPATGRAAGRYAGDKVPTPAGYKGRRPFWKPAQIPDLVAWRLRHEDRGGNRRKRRTR